MTIAEIVESSGLNQSAFAREYHIPLRTLQDWIAGRRTPPEYVTWMLERLLDR